MNGSITVELRIWQVAPPHWCCHHSCFPDCVPERSPHLHRLNWRSCGFSTLYQQLRLSCGLHRSRIQTRQSIRDLRGCRCMKIASTLHFGNQLRTNHAMTIIIIIIITLLDKRQHHHQVNNLVLASACGNQNGPKTFCRFSSK